MFFNKHEILCQFLSILAKQTNLQESTTANPQADISLTNNIVTSALPLIRILFMNTVNIYVMLNII